MFKIIQELFFPTPKTVVKKKVPKKKTKKTSKKK